MSDHTPQPDGRRWRVRQNPESPADFLCDYWMPPRPILMGEQESFWLQVAGGYDSEEKARKAMEHWHGPEFEEQDDA